MVNVVFKMKYYMIYVYFKNVKIQTHDPKFWAHTMFTATKIIVCDSPYIS